MTTSTTIPPLTTTTSSVPAPGGVVGGGRPGPVLVISAASRLALRFHRMLEQLPHGQCLTGGPVLGYGNLDVHDPSKQRESQLARAAGATEFRP